VRALARGCGSLQNENAGNSDPTAVDTDHNDSACNATNATARMVVAARLAVNRPGD
jgi:hypothetical protein